LFDGWLANGRHVIVGSKFVTKGNPPPPISWLIKNLFGVIMKGIREIELVSISIGDCHRQTVSINQSSMTVGTCSEIRYIIWKNGEMNLLLVIQVISLSDWRLKEVGFELSL
jgi:hypothetical protein